MLFKERRSHADGNLHGIHIIGSLVSGVADLNIRIALLQKANLAEVEIRIASRILADTVHDGEDLGTMAKKTYHPVDVLQTHTSRGSNKRFIGLRDPLQEGPIGKIAARNLYEIVAMLFDPVD